jgi:hypothetical protein
MDTKKYSFDFYFVIDSGLNAVVRYVFGDLYCLNLESS